MGWLTTIPLTQPPSPRVTRSDLPLIAFGARCILLGGEAWGYETPPCAKPIMLDQSKHKESTNSPITFQLTYVAHCMVCDRVYVCTFVSIAGVRLF